MRTDEIIRNLKYTAKKHENDRVFTGQTHISAMCKDLIPKMEQLKAYEDAEEQGLLLRLPCKVGDTMWAIRNHCGVRYAKQGIVSEMFFTKDMKLLIVVKSIARGELGQKVFFTKEEAEKKIAEMGGEWR